jgi:hypothetical protein
MGVVSCAMGRSAAPRGALTRIIRRGRQPAGNEAATKPYPAVYVRSPDFSATEPSRSKVRNDIKENTMKTNRQELGALLATITLTVAGWAYLVTHLSGALLQPVA